MLKPIRIILVDDHQLVRESWQFLLNQDPMFEVIALCKNGIEAIEQASAILPDIMLMDINMTPINGFEATKKITATAPTVKIIGVSANNTLPYANKLISLGAKGYVTKTSSLAELKLAIQNVFEGGIYICQEVRKIQPE